MGEVSVCGLGHIPALDTVLNATLDKFVSLNESTIVIDDTLPLESYIKDYLDKNHPSNSVCFFDCSNILNQYKTWFNVFRDVQPFYGSACGFLLIPSNEV